MIAESVVAEAVAFYRLMVTTSTVFLGGTLVFWEKVAPKPTQETLVMLGAGWLFLIATIVRINLDVAHGLKDGDTRVHLSSGFSF